MSSSTVLDQTKPPAPVRRCNFFRKGVINVRPLLGGLEAWRERGYPLEPVD